MNVADNITRLVPQLHADSVENLVWWNDCEIRTWLDEAAKLLARTTSLFITRDTTSIALVEGQALYDLPARHVATLFVNLNGKPLIPISTNQLEMLDPRFANAVAGEPERWYEDKQQGGKVGFYPPPDGVSATGEVAILMIQSPITLDCDGDQTTMVLPTPLEDFLDTFALSRAWNKDSDVKCVEIGNHLAERAKLYGQICSEYWGTE